MGETAISETIITPIKQQEPGHFAFYQMSATAMIQDKVLKPWQLFLTRVLREKSFNLVGTNNMRQYKADMGGVAVDLGLDADLAGYAREIGRVEQPAALGAQAGHGLPALHPQGPAGERRALPGAHRPRPGLQLSLTQRRGVRARRSSSRSSSAGTSTKANRIAESLHPYGTTSVSPCSRPPQE